MAILHYPLRRIRDKFLPEALPPAESFVGRTVLVTGATSGLGYAAAVHFVKLGAEVLITSRTETKGRAAKSKIEKEAKISSRDGEKISCFELNLDDYDSCVQFFARLTEHFGKRKKRLDCAVLNAGVVSAEYIQSRHGWEETIQVNALSTILLGLLLLPWMKETASEGQSLPHLVMACSRAHLEPDIAKWADAIDHGSILRHLNSEKNYDVEDLRPNYDVSKLLLMYATREMCKQATGIGGRPQVIINPVCPGLVHTNIGETARKKSFFLNWFIPIWLGTLGKSPDYGARTYLKACQTNSGDHGRFLQTLYTEEEYQTMAIPNLTSNVARIVQASVWEEISAELAPFLAKFTWNIKSHGQNCV